MIRILHIVFALGLSAAPLHAATDRETIDRWYAMLMGGNAQGLGDMLADNAVIRLTDTKLALSKTEFLATMDDWRAQIVGAGIRHKVIAENGVTIVMVCYDFADNDILMSEKFRISGGLITENSQTRVADDCSGF